VQTARDQEIVAFIGRVGAASAEHVQAQFGMCQSRAYARLRVLVRDGLLEHKQLLHRVPGPLRGHARGPSLGGAPENYVLTKYPGVALYRKTFVVRRTAEAADRIVLDMLVTIGVGRDESNTDAAAAGNRK